MQQGRALGRRYHEIRYEEITESPEAAFRDIFEFLGLPYEAAVLVAGRARNGAAASKELNVTRNLRRANYYFSPAMIAKMEAVAGRLLAELGYHGENSSGDRHPGRWHLWFWQFTDDLRRLGTMASTHGRGGKPKSWRYLINRVRNALKQKSTL